MTIVLNRVRIRARRVGEMNKIPVIMDLVSGLLLAYEFYPKVWPTGEIPQLDSQ